MKNYTFYGILFTLSAYLCFLAACGEGETIDLSDGSTEWRKIEEIMENLTGERGLISDCINYSPGEPLYPGEICETQEVASSSSEEIVDESSSSNDGTISISSSSNETSGDSSSSEANGESSSSVASNGSSSSNVGNSSSSSITDNSSSSKEDESSSSNEDNNNNDVTGGSLDNPLELPNGSGNLPSGNDLEELNGIVYITGQAGTGNNHNTVQLNCGSSRGMTVQYADCYSGTCGTNTELSGIGNSGAEHLPSSLFHDCSGNDRCSFNIRLTLTKDNGGNWPSCSING